MTTLNLTADLSREFDADYRLDVPAESYRGWHSVDVCLPLATTGLAVMHAWDCGTPAQYPGWHRAEEYLQRADVIARDVFPPLLAAARAAGMPVLHVVGGRRYYQDLPGYRRAVELAGPAPVSPPGAQEDETLADFRRLRRDQGHPGAHNLPDIETGWARLDFAATARPHAGELIAENGWQLNACCRHLGVNHLVYVGFALNWCLVMSPGGMVDMSRLGYCCSTIAEATTAVETRDTARHEGHKREGLWRVAVGFGFVFHADPFVAALKGARAD